MGDFEPFEISLASSRPYAALIFDSIEHSTFGPITILILHHPQLSFVDRACGSQIPP